VAVGRNGSLNGSSVRIERCGGHELAVHLREQERTLAKPAAVERGEAFERGSVAVSAGPDQDGLRKLQRHSRRGPIREPT
jgi:hypothetical protein